jgi:hypothetical protein
MPLDRNTLELTVGRDNVRKWADMDNDGDEADIERRVEHALEWAALHFSSLAPGAPSNTVSNDVILKFAAIWLYESRGRAEEDATRSPVAHLRKYCHTWVDAYNKSTIRFTPHTAPSII